MPDYVLQLGEGGEENECLVFVRSGVVVGAVTDLGAIRVAEFLAANERPEPGISRACLLRNGRVIWSKPLLEVSAQLKALAAKE